MNKRNLDSSSAKGERVVGIVPRAGRTSEVKRNGASSPPYLAGIDRDSAETMLRQSQIDLRALATRLDHVREEERRHLARELHDHFGQTLTALKLELSTVLRPMQSDRDTLEKRVNTMIAMCDTIVADVRRVSQSLRPSVLDDLGLAAAVESGARDFEKHTGVPCQVSLSGDDAGLARGHVTAVYRILQEALTNVARHAGAKRVDVKLHVGDTAIELLVRDDGKGFVKQANRTRSLGLLGMRERAIACGGEIVIRSPLGIGTRVMVHIPLAQTE